MRIYLSIPKPLLFTLFLFITPPIYKSADNIPDNPYEDRIVRCAIALDDDMYESDGLEAGLHYELLHRFSEQNRCTVDITSYGKKSSPADSLKQDSVDIIIIEGDKIMSDKDIFVSTPISNGTRWAVRQSDFDEIEYLNNWLYGYMQTEGFKQLETRFIRRYSPRKRRESGRKYNTLSPYDPIIREDAAELGWDWKILVAILWQESKFSINSRSHRGAQGLMQVMPNTARYYDIHDLLNPFENIKAGTEHLKRIQRYFRKYNLTDEELVKFTLAAYNAGEGRITDCMNMAEHMQKDKTRWEEIVEVIPMMNNDSLMVAGNIRLGKFKGIETISYVSSVMSIYSDLCEIYSGQD